MTAYHLRCCQIGVFKMNLISLVGRMDILPDRHTQASWLEDSQTSRKTRGQEIIHCILSCKRQILHWGFPSFLSDPKSQPKGFDLSLRSWLSLLNWHKAKLKDWGGRDFAEKWRDWKLIWDRVSSSLVPHVLQKAEGCGENWRRWVE